jgi:DNA-directed RNA polymerase III subunit RPC11
MWDSADLTDASCPKCEVTVKAAFKQIQIRSADEPATIFYRCIKCGTTWSQN